MAVNSNLLYEMGGGPSGMNTDQLRAVDARLNQGMSWESIAQQTGVPLASVSAYSRATRPGYGIKKTPAADTSGTYVEDASGGGGSSTAAADAAARASFISRLQTQLGQLDPQLEIGLNNIANSYNRSANRLDEQFAGAERDYTTNTQQNTRSYLNNRNGIMQNTRANNSALQRLLGINGSGNSSAALEQAPYAAALQGSQELNGAQTTFAGNQAGLENNWEDTKRASKNAKEDLSTQRFQQENGLRSSIAQTRATILDKIAGAGTNPGAYDAEIGTLLSQITNLGKQYEAPVIRTADVKYETPNLSNWFLNNQQSAAAAPQQAGGGAASDVDPTFLGMLGEQKRDEYGQPVLA